MKDRHKVVHCSSVHAAFDTRIFERECKSLASEGYDVRLVAIADDATCDNGVQIRPIPRPRLRPERITLGLLRVLRATQKERPALVHFHDPELLPLGVLFKLLGKKVIFDVHEDVPAQIMTKSWISARLRRWIAFLARIILSVTARLFDGIVAATEDIADGYQTRRVVTIRNFPRPDELFSEEQGVYSERPSEIAYVGGISEPRGAIQMVEAMGLLPEDLPATLSLVGEFRPSILYDRCRERRGWHRIDYLAWQDRAGVGRVLSRARIGLLLFQPAPHHVRALPNKMFEYMSAGVPVIASDFPLWRSLIHEAQCGLVVDPTRPDKIAEAIAQLLQNEDEAADMGLNGRQAVLNRFNWRNEEAKLFALYRDVLQGHPV